MLHDFQNATLKVGAVDFFPFFEFVGGNKYRGVSYEILKLLATALNFRYEITKVRPGGIKRNGSWSEGVIKDIYEGKYDIGIDIVSMTYERYEAVEFSFPFMFDKSTIMSPAPAKENRTFAIVQVFAPEVWLLLFIAVALFVPIMKIVENTRKKFGPKLPSTEQVSVWSYVWMTVCIALFKGIQSFKGSAPRIIILFWTIMMMILVAMYSGILLALMSEQTLSKAVDNLEDLVQVYGMTWGVFPSSATRTFIDTAEKRPYIEISKKYLTNTTLMPGNVSFARELLRRGKYALISDEIIFKNIRTQEVKDTGNCPYYISKDHLFIQWYSFIMHKNCTFVRSIDIVIQHLIESGLIDFWLRETLGTSLDVCDAVSVTEQALHNLKIEDMQGAFIVLILGILVAFVCLLLEFVSFGKEVAKRRFWKKVKLKKSRKRRILLKEEILKY